MVSNEHKDDSAGFDRGKEPLLAPIKCSLFPPLGLARS